MSMVFNMVGGGGGNQYVWNKHALLIPSGYTAVEWIRSSGTQYIDTGFKPNQDTRVVMDLVFPLPSANAVAFGCFNNSSTIGYAFFASSGGYRKDYNADWSVAQSQNITSRFIVDKNKNVLTIDGNTYNSAYGTFSVGLNMFLFARNTGIADCFSSITVYGCRIYDNGVLVRNFVPCVNESGTAGMYDVVNEAFYTNAGTGTFSVGSESADLIVGESVGFVSSTNIGAYPNGGIKDGFYYESVGEEIAITENGTYDVRPFVSANVNVQSAPVLLWTNASPNSGFGEQTIKLATGYSAFLVELLSIYTGGSYNILYLPFNSNSLSYACQSTSGTSQNGFFRKIGPAVDGSITFGAAYLSNTAGAQYGYAIPTRIWGVKFTL